MTAIIFEVCSLVAELLLLRHIQQYEPAIWKERPLKEQKAYR